MTAGNDSKDVEPAWHERTSTVVGASVAALVVLGVLFMGVSCVSREFNGPPPASQYFTEPRTSGSATRTSGSTTTPETITSTSPPVTTDINPGDPTTTTSGTDTSTSDSSSSTTTTTSRTPSSTKNDGGTTSRQRPRLNETRTLGPRP